MKNTFNELMREQVQEGINGFHALSSHPTPKNGWIKTIREALAMSSYYLSKKLNCAQSNVIAMEKSEKKGTISLNTLEQAATAMNCKLVYCFIPLKPLNQLLEDRARILAQKQIEIINHSMGLEKQELNEKQLKKQQDVLVKELLTGNLRHLWQKDEI